MKQSISQILLTLLVSMFVTTVSAHDIAVENTDGVTIYYNWINNNTELAVSFRGSSYNSYGNEYSGDVVIPGAVTYNGNSYNVTSIGDLAFCNCTGLTSVSIPNGVISINNSAFWKCSGLTSVSIPNSVTSIGYQAFYCCSSLASITIPASVTSISYEVFYGCSGLTSIKVKNGNSVFDSRNNCNAIIKSSNNKLLYGCNNTVIPNSVTAIGENAFYNCKGLTSITIPASVTSISYDVFYGCSGLTSIKVEDGNSVYDSRSNCNAIIKSANNTLLYGCKTTTFPNSVTSIAEGAFGGRSDLSIIIPTSITSIQGGVFSNCGGSTTIKVEEGNPVYDSRDNCNAIIEKESNTLITACNNTVIPNSVTSIGSDAFAGCSDLTSITIPNNVTSICFGAFLRCGSLTSVTLPSSVTQIEPYAFASCYSLKSVTIGSGLSRIGANTFIGVNQITDVYCFAEAVPSISHDMTYGEEKRHYLFSEAGLVNLHVPAGSLEAYKADWEWNDNFKEILGTTVKVKLSKTKATIEKGKTVTLKATLSPNDLSDKSVIWKSSNIKVATVTSSGKVKGIKAGTATITCTSNVTGAKATCKVTVGYVSLDKTEAIIKKGKTLTLTPTVYPSSLTDKSVTWESSNTKVATVTNDGKVKGVKTGSATITCTSNATGLSTTCTVLVGNVVLSESKIAIQKGKTMTLKATVYPSSLEDKSVTWESSNTKVATVTNDGKVKGVKYGTATITCTSNATGVSATCQVTVGKVVISMSEFSIKKSRAITLEAAVYPSTLSDKSVTWVSSDTQVATVSSSGRVKGIKAGTTTITCTSNATGLSATCTVTVLSTSESRSVEGDDDNVTGIESIEEALEPYDVYDLSGRKVRHQVTSLDGLPAGVYIVNGKKMLKK